MEKVMERETIESLAMGGMFTGIITYLGYLLTKRHDKVDQLEARIVQLEVSQRDLVYIKEAQKEIKASLDTVLETLTTLLMQTSRRTAVRRKEERDA